MTTVCTIASGSSGNALVLSCEGACLLVDAGISCKRIVTGLGALGIKPQVLDGILITHTHTDHIAGLRVLLKRTACPVYATAPAARELALLVEGAASRLRTVACGTTFWVGRCAATAFPTSHDAPGSCGFRFDLPEGSVGLLTDTGYVTEEAEEALSGVALAVLEANHDVETLKSGPYPYHLKQRILGQRGHLSNEAAARFAVHLAQSGTGEIVLAHLSRENNTPAMALRAVGTALAAAGLSPTLSAAPRDALGCYVLPGKNIPSRETWPTGIAAGVDTAGGIPQKEALCSE